MGKGDSSASRAADRRRPGRPRHETPSAEFLQRRSEIVDMAAQVFRTRGYDAGSLDDVATALDLRRASLYHYVRSKNELLFRVFDRAISLALEETEKVTHEAGAPPLARLATLVRNQVRMVTSDLNLFSVFFDQRPHLDKDYDVAIRAKERRYVRVWAEVIDAATEAGALGPVDPRYAAQVFLGVANWTYKWFDPGRDDPEAFADVAVTMLLGPHAERSTPQTGGSKERRVT